MNPQNRARMQLVHAFARGLDGLAKLEARRRGAYQRLDLASVVVLDREIARQREAIARDRRALVAQDEHHNR